MRLRDLLRSSTSDPSARRGLARQGDGAQRLAVAAIAVAAVLAPSATSRADMRSLASPGALAEAHHAFDSQCDKCHVPHQGVPSERCLACHQATAKRIASGVGTHARFTDRACTSCHKDHRGRGHELSPPVDEKAFDHRVTGFALEGRHREARCGQCHLGGKWVGQATACAGCHGDAHHKGALGGKCETCHTPRGWLPPTRTVAQHKLPMTGGHQGLACASCHKGGTHFTKASQCGDCHAQKHGGTSAPCDTCHTTAGWKSATFKHDFCTCLLPGKHQTATCLSCHPGFVFRPTPMACASCHTKDRRHEDLGACARCHSALSWKKKVFDHDKQVPAFHLDGKHLEVGCESCHTKPGVFRGAPTACEGCHKTPTHGDFGPCARCHSTKGFDKPSFSHESTRFPLSGPHLGVTCQACHAKFKKGEFQQGPSECKLCHGDPHDGQFAPAPVEKSDLRRAPAPAAAARLAPTAGDARVATFRPHQCLDCHRLDRFVPSSIDRTRHEAFFPLVGAHAKLECARCHTPRPGGKHAQFVGLATTCAGCHFDAHGGRFGAACESCHDQTKFAPAPGFDHQARTGFALRDAHARLRCAGCHGEAGDKLDGKPRPVGCATCHTAPHGPELGADCARCHRPTRFSDVPRFDHRRTDFPLERRHAALPCLACHAATRGAPPNRQCASCHGDPHRGSAGEECADCHRPDRWLLVRFDHDRTEFPLRGRHFIVPCRGCHRDGQFVGLRGAECDSCHGRRRTDAP